MVIIVDQKQEQQWQQQNPPAIVLCYRAILLGGDNVRAASRKLRESTHESSLPLLV